MRAVGELQSATGRTRSSLFLGALILLSMAPAGLLGTASADDHIDLGFEEGDEPKDGLYYPLDVTLSMTVKVRNKDPALAFNAIRMLDWMFCADDHSADGCDENATLMSGSTWIGSLAPGAFKVIDLDEFSPTETGEYTIEAEFRENDVNSSNDNIRIVFTIVGNFIDFSIDSTRAVLPDLEHLNVWAGNRIYNSETNYPMTFNGTVESWPSNSTAQVGWRLLNGSLLIAEAYTGTQQFPVDDPTPTYFSFDAPALNSPQTGVFTLEYGLMTQGEDLNLLNNIHQVQVVFDDTLDIIIDAPVPLLDPVGGVYYASTNAFSATVRNIGNISVFDYLLKVEQLDQDGVYLDPAQFCTDLDLQPDGSVICFFDLLKVGEMTLKLTIPDSFQGISDVNEGDNTISIDVEVIAGNITAEVIQQRADSIYTLQDQIHLIAGASSTAPRPLAFDWQRSGWTLGSGEHIYLTALTLGSGDHNLSLKVTDALDRVVYVDFSLSILSSTAFEYGGDMIFGIAPARSNSHVAVSFSIVDEQPDFLIDEGLDPLYVFSLDVIDNLDPLRDPGLERIDMTLDLDKLLPVEVEDNSSITLYHLDPLTGDVVQLTDQEAIYDGDEGVLNVFVEHEGTFLVAAEFGRVNLSIENLDVTPGRGGSMTLTWDVGGDSTTPWLLEWHIFRTKGSALTLIPFNELEGASPETWEALTENKQVDTMGLTKIPVPSVAEQEAAVLCIEALSPDLDEENRTLAEAVCSDLGFDQRWEDNEPLAAGECASYVIVAFDRQGRRSWSNGGVSSLDEMGDGQGDCGDAEPPFVRVSAFIAKAVYDASETCLSDNTDYSRCYSVELAWNWPLSLSEPVDFNLYRTEQYTNDLSFAYPMATFENIAPGARIQWIDSGTNELMTFSDGTREEIVIDVGVRPDRVYYYYLTPIDTLGNEDVEPLPGNWLEVVIDEVSIAENHPDWIPPPPEPPETFTGTDFEVELQEYLNKPSFQVAGLVAIVTICLNMILIPYTLQKRKKASRLIEHLIETGQWDAEDEDDYY